MSSPWNNWWHCMGSTYGAWLRGDPRGWRTRHHREHVEGDYKHRPPPGVGKQQLDYSIKHQRRESVVLAADHRRIVCLAMVEKLRGLNIEVVDWVVTATHFHGLARFYPQSPGMAMPGLCKENALQDGRDPWPRHALGLAKKHASHLLRQTGGIPAGGLWAVRSKLEPIRDRSHQLAVVGYIRRHAQQGGAVWSTLNSQSHQE